MAKAREIPGLRADLPFALAARRSVAVRAAEVFEHQRGVLDTEAIKGVHAMRVATRRLRAILEMYRACFPPDELRPVLRDVKALADALGARRDPDVELLALEQFMAGVGPDERAGLELLVTRARSEQAAANLALAAALEALLADDLAGRLRALAGEGDA